MITPSEGGLVAGKYRLQRLLGSGASGSVWAARNELIDRDVALKIMRPDVAEDAVALQRFFNEVRIIAQLEHPNIVGAFDAGQVPGVSSSDPTLHYFVMEFVRGRDLEDSIKTDGPMTVAQAFGLAYQIASALAEAH